MGNKRQKNYVITCPFCGKQHKQYIYINIICGCGAKFYYKDCLWLNRKNGEREFCSLFDLTFEVEGENEPT